MPRRLSSADIHGNALHDRGVSRCGWRELVIVSCLNTCTAPAGYPAVSQKPPLTQFSCSPARAARDAITASSAWDVATHAIEVLSVPLDAPAINLSDVGERQRTENDRIEVSTGPDPDGVARRIEVRARSRIGRSGARQPQRRADQGLLVAPHHRLVDPGLFGPVDPECHLILHPSGGYDFMGTHVGVPRRFRPLASSGGR
jgi:hypothetical protein